MLRLQQVFRLGEETFLSLLFVAAILNYSFRAEKGVSATGEKNRSTTPNSYTLVQRRYAFYEAGLGFSLAIDLSL